MKKQYLFSLWLGILASVVFSFNLSAQFDPCEFRWNEATQEEVGFIAQEVREVIPDAVTEGQDGYLSLKADPIHWAAINAIQELNTQLKEQRAENAELKQRLDKLEERMNQKNGGAK